MKDRWAAIERKGYTDFSISEDVLILIDAIEECENEEHDGPAIERARVVLWGMLEQGRNDPVYVRLMTKPFLMKIPITCATCGLMTIFEVTYLIGRVGPLMQCRFSIPSERLYA